MIEELRIRGLGVVADSTCEFSPGFTAVTGETGAGKTMVITGLGLLSGAKSDPALVRTGQARAEVDGLVVLNPDSGVAELVAEAGGHLDGDLLTVARIVPAQGRGRCVVGGRSTPASVLTEVMSRLVTVHGQHEQGRLGARQQQLLDRFAGPATLTLAAQYRSSFDSLREAQRQLGQLLDSRAERERELDMLTFALGEIDRVQPIAGEDALLAAEADRLANVEQLASAAESARSALAGDEAGFADAPSALALLDRARRMLDSARRHDVALDQPWQVLGEASALVADAAAELAAYSAGLDDDPARLGQVQQRLADLAGLTRKYGRDVDGVLAWARQSQARLAELSGSDAQVELLRAQVVEQRRGLADLGRRLHEARLAAADLFTGLVQTELAALAMPKARVHFEVRLTDDTEGLDIGRAEGPVAYGASGLDRVTLMMSPHPGAPERPVAAAASGGELSRIMLATQVVLADADPVPTMVFDEIDAGVGGQAAIEVGRRLARLAHSRQVIVVTHLAQVAAFADRQVVVAKSDDGQVTAASIQVVSGEDRVLELSRMLGGLATSASGAAHARELLELAGQSSNPD